MPRSILEGQGVTAGYGNSMVLHDLNIKIEPETISVMIGHNGAGKSTLLRALYGLIPVQAGRILLDGKAEKIYPRRLLEKGIVYLPQSNSVFPSLSVEENLQLIGASYRADSVMQNIFPEISGWLGREAKELSGGQRQIVALAMAFSRSPRLLLLDEPTLGLSQNLGAKVFQRVRELCTARRTGALIIEQHVREALKIADHVFILKQGKVIFSGKRSELSEKSLGELYL